MNILIRKLMALMIMIGLLAPSSVWAQSGGDPEPPDQVETASTALAATGGNLAAVQPQDIGASAVTTVTLLHTNDFHGYLDPTMNGSDPGIARVATVIYSNTTPSYTVLVDAGDEMQGTLLSNLKKGRSVIDLFNYVGHDHGIPMIATLGNHEFDWGQTELYSRTQEAAYPFISANIVVNDTGNCATAGWDKPNFVYSQWVTMTVGTPGNEEVLAFIGVTNPLSPLMIKAGNTDGLCFKDPVASIGRYYSAMAASGANAIIVISHIGYDDGDFGGIPYIGDKTLAARLAAAGNRVDVIIGGHSHSNLSSAYVYTDPLTSKTTTVAQAYRYGRAVGRFDLTFDQGTRALASVAWRKLTVSMTEYQDPGTLTRVNVWKDAEYTTLVNQQVGFTNVDLTRSSSQEAMMADFIDDAVYDSMNTDADLTNDVDLVFNNSGGFRTDITSTTYPLTLTYGALFSVLPFGNAVIRGSLTGGQVLELLDQSAASWITPGMLHASGIRYTYFSYTDTVAGAVQPWAWGVYSVTVYNRSTLDWEPLVLTKTYSVATNDFLAPGGGDSYSTFKYFTTSTLYGDMLDMVVNWVGKTYSTTVSAYNGPHNGGTLDGRVIRNGSVTYDPADPSLVVPVIILHHNDSHGRLYKVGTTAGYSQLATLIKRERQHAPTRTLLLSSGDNIQGDSMSYYFKSAGLGYTADGIPLSPPMNQQPLIAAFNAMSYTAMTLGNHEFNFGPNVFTSSLGLANFPILQANLYDDGRYGISKVPVLPATAVTVPGPTGYNAIKVGILGIGNHRVPSYEMPSDIPGLTFTNPITEAQARTPALRAANDLVIALTHIGFTENLSSVEVDSNVDTNLAAQTSGLDVVIGGHSHTPPYTDTVKFGTGVAALGAYKYIPAFVRGPNDSPVLINQANRYNTWLGQIVVGLLPNGSGGYTVMSRAGRNIEVTSAVAEDPAILAIAAPYSTTLKAYTDQVVGPTSVPIDTLSAFTQETNGGNLQADAAMWKLRQGSFQADLYLSGAMSNAKVAASATTTTPVTMTVNDMFTLMFYENSIVVLNMTGPELKTILERAYRNFYYYKHVPGYGGYSYYTTCMLGVNAGGQIFYRDQYPKLPDGNNVAALVYTDTVTHQKVAVDFNSLTKVYKVATVNYLAAGACNFSDSGTTLWPIHDSTSTGFFVRDSVIDYVRAQGGTPIAPAIESRLAIVFDTHLLPVIRR